MAITWAQGLLAGAAGVAEYSNQQQAKRQKRMDRTHELQNQMRLIHAKSAYASKVKEYEKNRSTLQSLEGVEPGSLAEQVTLHKSLGFSEKAAFAASKSALASKNPLARPGSMKLPEFEIPNMMQGQASSPIQDWARNIKKSFSTEPRELPEQPVTEEAPSFQPGVHPAPTEFGKAVPAALETESPIAPEEAISSVGGISEQDQMTLDAMAPKVEYQTAVWQTEVGEDGNEYKVPYYQEKGTNKMVKGKPIAPTPVKVNYDITKQETARNLKGGTLVTGINPNDPTDTWSQFIPSGNSGFKTLPLQVEALPDGSESTTERYMDLETNEIYEGDVWISKKGEGNIPLRTQSFSEYMNPGSDTKAKGRFFADFPKEERDAWIKWNEKDEGVFSIAGNDMPADLPERMGATMQDQMNIIRSKLGPDIASNPNKQSYIKDYAKARTYLKVLGQEAIVEMINEGNLPKELFYSPYANQAPSIKRLHTALGIDNPESKEYRKLTNFNNEDQMGDQWKTRASKF